MKKPILASILVTAALSIILSCTPSVQKESVLPAGDTVYLGSQDRFPILPDIVAPGGLIVDNPEEIIRIADTIASNAEIAALENDFPRAHVLFSVALELITTFGQDNVFDTLAATDTVFNRIAEFYVDLLPSNYLDSVPSAISSFVARYQLNEMMDNMDSTVLETSKITFGCSEGTIYNVPVTYNRRVQQAIRALTTPQREQTMNRLLNRAHFYRPFMADMFTKAGLPSDLTYLPLLESAFNPKAYSPAHASGLWQFIPSTGRMYNMRDNYWVDERRDPIKSTQAAIGYFTRLNRMFNDWYLSLASYNCGEGRVSRTMARTGATSYWSIPLPKETMNYVPLFVAYQIIAKNPQCFGYKVDTTAATFSYDTVKVSDCIDLQRIADAVGTSYDSLKSINPHIKHWCTPPNMSNINLYLPTGTSPKYYAFYKTLTDKEKIVWHRYLVKKGDTVDKIAQRFNVSAETLISSNKMSGSTLAVGRYIVIPIPASGGTIDTADHIEPISADTLKTSLQEPAPEYTTVKKSVTKTIKKYHTVKRGETLSSIARKYGVEIREIAKWNNISTSSKLGVGKRLKIFKLEKTTITIKKKITPPAPKVEKPAAEKLSYTVTAGETAYSIAEKLGVTVVQLAKWNSLDTINPQVQADQKLSYIPAKTGVKSETKAETKTVKADSAAEETVTEDTVTEDSSVDESDDSVKSEPVKSSAPAKTSVKSGEGDKLFYTAAAGETLFSISQKLGVSLQNICSWNGKDINNPSLLVGEKLVYYKSGKAPESAAPAKTKTAVKEQGEKQTHTVSSGETMSSIAEKLNVTVQQLCEWNNRSSENPTVFKDEKLIYYGTKVKESEKTKEPVKPAKEKLSYTVSSGETMAEIADKLNVTVKQMCEWNNRSASKPVVYRGEKLTYYSSEPVKEKESVSSAKSEKKSYVVSSGETMSSVAEKLGVTVKQLCEWNEKSLKNPSIYRGEKLAYYESGSESTKTKSGSAKKGTSKHTVKKGESMFSIAKEYGISVEELVKLNSMNTERPLQLGETIKVPGSSAGSKSSSSAKSSKKHVVKKGETLWNIAEKNDVTVDALCKANGISSKTALQAGQKLTIPSKE